MTTELWDSFKVYARDEAFIFSSKAELISWIEKEQSIWAWLWGGKGSGLDGERFKRVHSAWAQGANYARAASDNGEGNYRQWKNLRMTGSSADRLIISDTVEGRDVLAVKDAGGVVAGRWAYLFRVGNAPFDQVKTNDDLRGLILSAFPAMADPEAYRDVLQKERRNYREEISRIQREVGDYQASRILEWRQRYRRARRISKVLLSETVQKFNDANDDFSHEANKTIGELNATKELYEKQMALAAPVKYWDAKSTEHRSSERLMLGVSAAYFFVALLGLWIVASRAAAYILALPKDVDRAAIYVIVSGGLLAFTTMVFWIGRVVMKLYLSEHHLRIDSAERAVMTKTYLAMTEQGGATDTERAIVLTSIFRPSPDGIVKDDGPTDASLGGILSKFLTTK